MALELSLDASFDNMWDSKKIEERAEECKRTKAYT
jgi:hypothetical protein